MFVNITTKHLRKVLRSKGFYFDKNGLFETENPLLIRVMEQNFEVAESPESVLISDVIEEPTEEVKAVLKHCKKCDFECENQGELLAHYKSEHPKNKEVK